MQPYSHVHAWNGIKTIRTDAFGLVKWLKTCNLCFHMKAISNNPIIQIYKKNISNCEACVILLRHHNIEAICKPKWDVRRKKKKEVNNVCNTLFDLYMVLNFTHWAFNCVGQIMILG